MYKRVGTCSLCSGDVIRYKDFWPSIQLSPSPPDRCSTCGAVSRSDIITMYPDKKPPEINKYDWMNPLKWEINLLPLTFVIDTTSFVGN